jgi:uncharacterized protein (DUF58 family)
MQPSDTYESRVYTTMADLMAQEGAARGLSFSARQPLASILAGQHGSRLRGRGLNFEELRRYLPGDDLRQLDWRASLRFGKPYVRTYSEERDRPALIVVDQRMGMFFGSAFEFKSVAAARLAALSAWMVYQAGDRVGGAVFSDRAIDRIRPLRSRERIAAFFAAIVRRNRELAAGNADVDSAGQLNVVLQGTLASASHDSLICIISDFAGADEHTLGLLRRLAAHNDVVATLVYDPLALNLPRSGRPVVTQGELQIELNAGSRQVHKPLSEFFTNRLHGVAEMLRRSHLPLMSIDTTGGVAVQVRRELGRHAARRGP